MTDSDDDLWGRCRTDDRSAMAALFRRHADAIYAHAFRATGDWSRAEDVVSVVFAEAWRRRDTEVESGSVVAWLYGVATNVLRNEKRTRKRHWALLNRLRSANSVEQSDGFSERLAARIDDKERAQALLQQVRELPQAHREVIAMCWWSGLTYDEAAFALDIPVGTVRSRLSRARARLDLDENDLVALATTPIREMTSDEN